MFAATTHYGWNWSPHREFRPLPAMKKAHSEVKPTPGSEDFKRLSTVSITWSVHIYFWLLHNGFSFASTVLDQLMEEDNTKGVVFGSVRYKPCLPAAYEHWQICVTAVQQKPGPCSWSPQGYPDSDVILQMASDTNGKRSRKRQHGDSQKVGLIVCLYFP